MKWIRAKTPRALVDLDRVEKNTVEMSERIRRLGARLRPHVKTHKCAEAARFQVRGHFGGITVSTLAEARFFAEAGFRDITYAVPLSVARIEDAAAVARSVESLHVLVDHASTVAVLEDYATSQRHHFSAFLKVDCGYHRAGVDPESEDAVRLALSLSNSSNIDFQGILTHAGHSYGARNPEEIRRIAEEERGVMTRFTERLAEAGAPPAEISVGSTPTMTQGESLEGVSEARPGNYVFFDRFQATIGSCALDDVAFSVLVSVNGLYPERGSALIDAGALAFSKDGGPTHVAPDGGYGAIFDAATGARREDLILDSLSQEHGTLRPVTPAALDSLEVGQKLRIVPNHSCLSAALFESYCVVRGDEAVDEWRPARGW